MHRDVEPDEVAFDPIEVVRVVSADSEPEQAAAPGGYELQLITTVARGESCGAGTGEPEFLLIVGGFGDIGDPEGDVSEAVQCHCWTAFCVPCGRTGALRKSRVRDQAIAARTWL